MKRPWNYLINTFEVNTRRSKLKMLRIANHHDARLHAAAKYDPDIMALYTIFHAALLIFQSLMAVWLCSKGIGKGNTRAWEDLLDEMTDEWFDKWQNMVFRIYPRRSPEAKGIFPKKKRPFQSGRYEIRMAAVQTLHFTLKTYPELEAVADAVGEKLKKLQNTRDQQMIQLGTTVFKSSDLEAQRIVLANLLDDNLGDLKKKYRPRMGTVEIFFDLGLLRKKSSDDDAIFQFKGTVGAGATTALPVPSKLKLSANAVYNFTNRSNQAELQFFFAASASAADNPVKITALPQKSAEGTAAEAGWAPGMGYIIVKNMGTVTADFGGTIMMAVE